MAKSRKSVALRFAGHAANDLFWFILPLVLPLLLKRYGLSYARAGGIITFYLAISAAGSYVMGRISDGIPRRYMMGIGLWVAASGLIAAAFAGTFPVFLAFIAVTAVGMSTFHPAMYAHIDETYSGHSGKGAAMAGFEASGTVAILLMFLINGALLETLGSRGVMVITAVPAIIVGGLLLRARVLESANPRIREASASPRRPPSSASEAVADGNAMSHAPLALFVLFLIATVLRTMSVTAVLNFLPTIFTDYFHLPPNRATWASGLFFAGGIFGSLAAARFARPDRSYKILIGGGLLITPVIASLALTAPLGVHLGSVVLLGILGSGLLVNQNLIIGQLGSRFGRGEAFGIVMAVMTLTSSVAPSLFGWTVDSWGFAAALLLFSLPVLLNAALLVGCSRRMHSVVSWDLGAGLTENS